MITLSQTLRRGVAVAATLALTVGAAATTPVASAAEPTVTIPDKALLAAINAEMGQGPNEPITKSQAQARTSLYLTEKNISDITGLEDFTSLQVLSIQGNAVSNVSPLAGLIDLSYLDLGYNKIQNISPLSKLIDLETLYISNNRVKDVSSLSRLTKLNSLSLDYNEISNISALSNMKLLEALHLSSNKISDVSPLSGLTNLTYLHLYSNTISDVSPLAGLTKLRDLILDDNKIKDVSSLSRLANLELLYLSGNKIVDVSALASLKKTDSVNLHVQKVELPAASAGVQVKNPLRDVNGKVVAVWSQSPDLNASNDDTWWSFSKPGKQTVNWVTTVSVGSAKAVEFSGAITQTIQSSAGGESEPEVGPFPDVPVSNVHVKNISWLKDQGITAPVGGKFLPQGVVTRGSMATFLYRLVNPNGAIPKCTSRPFPDVAVDYVHCGAIAWAAKSRITVGDANGLYRPLSPVTRGSMATFLYRIVGSPSSPACAGKPFTDVAGSYVHCKTIQWAKKNGITSGLAGGQKYGPEQVVNRDQMASFLHRIHDYMR